MNESDSTGSILIRHSSNHNLPNQFHPSNFVCSVPLHSIKNSHFLSTWPFATTKLSLNLLFSLHYLTSLVYFSYFSPSVEADEKLCLLIDMDSMATRQSIRHLFFIWLVELDGIYQQLSLITVVNVTITRWIPNRIHRITPCRYFKSTRFRWNYHRLFSWLGWNTCHHFTHCYLNSSRFCSEFFSPRQYYLFVGSDGERSDAIDGLSSAILTASKQYYFIYNLNSMNGIAMRYPRACCVVSGQTRDPG